jgi:hypothetical protein
VIVGFREEPFVWWPPIAVNEPTLRYALAAPSPQRRVGARLAYFARFLEDPEPAIANDAFLEMCHARLDDIAGIAKDLPRDKLREWRIDAQTPEIRLGWYTLWLGLCGNDDDARLLEQKILESADRRRPDISFVMASYLLLTGDKGLAVLEREKVEQPAAGQPDETWDVMVALRTVWSYGNRPIKRERLCQSMRLFLDRPDRAAEAVETLARWQDWSMQDRLMEMYDSERFSEASIKRAIARYLLDCVEATADREGDTRINARARELLDRLRKKDPQTVSRAESVFRW